MSQYTLLGMGSPNVVKVVLLLEELELDYKLATIDLIEGEQHTPSFRAVGPNGKVPVLIQHRETGNRAVFESGAILLDLAERYGQFLGEDADVKSTIVQWLMFQMSGAGPMFGQAIHFSHATDECGYGKMRFANEMDRLLGVIETRLTKSPWLGGDAYSIADIAQWPWIRTLTKFFRDRGQGAATSAWFDRIISRPATARTLAIMSPIQRAEIEKIKAASPEEMDRYFGRTAR